MESKIQQPQDDRSAGDEPSTKTIIDGESVAENGASKLAVQIGGKIGKYQIRSQLGVGGMGAVYLAFDPLIEREVAIKVLTQEVASSSAALQRFLQEARSIGRLNHPNVVSIFDIDQWNGQYYLVMELLSGGSLADLVEKQGPLPWQLACQMIAQAASGLSAAHAAGMVHRDIKPENLMQTKEGYVKVVDFGLSKLVDAANDTRTAVTKQGQILGTPQYMSPEQFEAVELDSRTDVYSLGASLFRLLTGRFPFQDCSSIVQTMMAHLNKPVPNATAFSNGTPAECDRIIARAMAKKPTERYQDASELADELMELVRAHAGLAETTVSMHSARLNIGPRTHTASFSKPATLVIDKSSPLKSALICEPSKMLAAMLKDAITRAGAASVRVTSSKEQALKEMQSDVPDLLVTSMQLPDGLGTELLAEVGAPSTSSGTCLVLNSNDLTIADLTHARSAASRVLAPKKVRPDDLLRVVHAAGPCVIEQGPIATPVDPLAVRLVVISDLHKLPGELPDLIREIGLLDVSVLPASEAGSLPADEIPTVVLHVRESEAVSGDDITYAERPDWFDHSRHLLAEIQFSGQKLLLRAVHRLGVTASTCRLLNVNVLTNLFQSCRPT